ncbi:hypothetical protein RintRC_0787 [Richelia intracellularis]|nr:hypothetical protein RintRC_0787 [Richelia intracellularis]
MMPNFYKTIFPTGNYNFTIGANINAVNPNIMGILTLN